MPGNPILRPASVHPFHRSGAITDDPRPERGKQNEQQLGQTDDGGQAPAPPAQARQQVLAAELADFLWKRQEPGLDQPPLSTGGGSGEQDSGMWRDQLLAEIEGLAATLKEKVARYSLTQAPQPAEQAAGAASETAVLWIQDALEDIAATALGIEMASRELFIRAGSNGEQDSTSETAHEQTPRTAE
ncbi:hypothetical protein [Arthrobacter sp. AL12]|uniref:hypothetical protein n=1 Tax=Arthrobacter sp. AL12 TaxID=3042241 RepID=UPI002499F286|nr:hypothetical protein [Arthrobacter sp. AL12]MDI3210889.1 hypothetical protein [Arthrobacter sp. AL12]